MCVHLYVYVCVYVYVYLFRVPFSFIDCEGNRTAVNGNVGESLLAVGLRYKLPIANEGMCKLIFAYIYMYLCMCVYECVYECMCCACVSG